MSNFSLTHRALKDLYQIENYSQQQWGTRRAASYMEALYDGFDHIATFPKTSQTRQERAQPFDMQRIEQHMVIYTIKEKQVIILTVLHASQNIEAILRKLKKELKP